MDRRFSIFTALIFMAMAFPAFAEDTKTYHAFGGTVLEVPVSFEGQDCRKMMSSMVQMSTATGRLILEGIKTICDEPIEVALPNVRAITKMKLYTTIYGESKQEEIEAVTIKVYPDTQMEMVKLWAMDRILYVDDPDGYLLEALDKYDIGYQGFRSGKTKEIKAVMKMGKRQFLFKEKADLLPIITVRPEEVVVDMPFLEGLSEDPAKQKLLSDLFLNVQQIKTKEK